MENWYLLLIIALVLRISGHALRIHDISLPIRALGWLLCMASLWVALSALGAWATIWPALLMTGIGLWVDARVRADAVRPAADLLAILGSGLASIPPLASVALLASVAGLTAAGFALDWLVERLPQRARLALPITTVVASVLLIFGMPQIAEGTTRTLSTRMVEVGLSWPYQPEAARTAVPPTPAAANSTSLDRNGTQWTPFLEWSLNNPNYSGNPFDLLASATFVHAESGETRTTEMFYAGGSEWRFRFTGTRSGLWTFTTKSADPELNGKQGKVRIEPNPGVHGFVESNGNKWIRTGTNQAFVPQLVIYSEPAYFYNNPKKIDADIQTFIVEHGFNGFHVPVFCHWFELGAPQCNKINRSDPNPDPRTFEALEQLITRVHAAGGVVHLWAWGDDSRGENPKRWKLNGTQDQRVLRYIAARLGPLPGWTMGYGYDLFEWVDGKQLTTWHAYLQARMGWSHPLGARATKNTLEQISEAMDYAAYEQHRPDYDTYVATIERRPNKPAFSEDRFRIRDEGREKDYTPDDTRRGLWRSTMAGGVANIWGNLLDGGSHERGSAPYPNKAQIRSYADFFKTRFVVDLARCNELSDGVCLKRPTNQHYLFYREDAASIRFDLTAMRGSQRVVAVDTLRPYAEIVVGTLAPGKHTWQAPYPSDWALAVGTF